MKDQKRKRTSILVIAGVLLMLAVIVGFFWHASRIKALPPKIFAQISECQALADLETAQEAPQDQNLVGMSRKPGSVFLAPFRSGCHQNLCIARSTMCALFTSQEVRFPNSIRLRMKFLPGYQ